MTLAPIRPQFNAPPIQRGVHRRNGRSQEVVVSHHSPDAPPSGNDLVLMALDNADASSRDPEVWKIVVSAENIGHAIAAMTALKQENSASMMSGEENLDTVLEKCLARGYHGQIEWNNARIEFGRWRARAIDLDKRLEDALRELRETRETQRFAEIRELLDVYRGRLQIMHAAVRQHRDAFTEDIYRGCEPSEYDQELWSLLRLEYGGR